MAYFKQLITGRVNGEQKLPKLAVQAQQLAATMAWQILKYYPTRKKPAEWKIYANLRGVMLADEVGGGKTFETLAILSKAFLESKAAFSGKKKFRVLILASPSIRSKWAWKEGDDLSYETFSSDHYNTRSEIEKFIKQTSLSNNNKRRLFDFFSKQKVVSKKSNWIDIHKQRQGVWLSSFTSLPPTVHHAEKSRFRLGNRGKMLFPNDFFDWIIVDEAHSLKSGSKDVEESLNLSSSAIRKIYAVLNASTKSKLLLLTATPFQNNKQELKFLLGLLDNQKGKTADNSIISVIANGIDAFEKHMYTLADQEASLEQIKNLQKSFNDDINILLERVGEDKVVRPNDLKSSGSKDGLDDFLRDVMVRNTKRQLSIKPIKAKLNEAEVFQYLLYRDLIKTTESESQMFSTKLSQLVSSGDSFARSNIDQSLNAVIEKLLGGNQVFEAKFNKLVEAINNISISKQKQVITVFVSWIATVDVLKRRFDKLFGKNRVFTLTGEAPTDEREKVLTRVSKSNETTNGKIILIASRVGNEGLDFDGFSNRVIHYDNNFNPAIIDQRNGRVYRGSNIKVLKGEVIHNDIEIYQLFLEETYDQRILFIEQEKRKLKNFYLGDASLQEVIEKTIKKNNLEKEKAFLNDILGTMKVDLKPRLKYILSQFRKEVSS